MPSTRFDYALRTQFGVNEQPPMRCGESITIIRLKTGTDRENSIFRPTTRDRRGIYKFVASRNSIPRPFEFSPSRR